MVIHKEGYRFIAYTLVILLIINLVVPYYSPINYILYGVSLIIFMTVVLFFRTPDRKVEIDENSILCPADGKIVAIEEVEENEYFHEKRLQVSIFMSITNVHVNWYPVSGTVKYIKYHPGKHLVAFHPKTSLKNERTTTVVENNNQRAVLIRQIAGAIARRVVCYAKESKQVTQGNELGIIKFGSRVDLLLPPNVDVQVKLNQKVTGSKTIIAFFNKA